MGIGLETLRNTKLQHSRRWHPKERGASRGAFRRRSADSSDRICCVYKQAFTADHVGGAACSHGAPPQGPAELSPRSRFLNVRALSSLIT